MPQTNFVETAFHIPALPVPLEYTIVVEGRSDVVAVKKAFDCDMIVTYGFRLRAKTLKSIRAASKKHEVIIFTDPDYGGEQIRRKIRKVVPNAIDAFLISDHARKDGDIGVENASAESIYLAITKAIHNYKSKILKTTMDQGVQSQESLVIKEQEEKRITRSVLMDMGLVGENSSHTRELVCDKLGFGHCNGKLFLEKLKRHQVGVKTLQSVLEHLQDPPLEHNPHNVHKHKISGKEALIQEKIERIRSKLNHGKNQTEGGNL